MWVFFEWFNYFEISLRPSQPQVKNQHLTALNKRRRLELCSSMLEHLGEAKEAAFRDLSCKTHISRSFGAILLLVSFCSADDVHAVLRRTVLHIVVAISVCGRDVSVTFRCLLVCVSMLLVGMSPRESIHDADCELFHLYLHGFLSFSQFRGWLSP